MKIGFKFVRWPETGLRMNADVVNRLFAKMSTLTNSQSDFISMLCLRLHLLPSKGQNH